MRKVYLKVASVLLAAAFLCQPVSGGSVLAASALDNSKGTPYHGMGYVDDGFTVDAPDGCSSENQVLGSAEIPDRYDLRELDRVTSVKDQGDFDTCWTFSAIACIESNLITQGYADTSLDLSEKHLAYFTYNYAPDKLGNTAGDHTASPGRNYLNAGGNSWLAANTLANREGVILEQDMPYDTPETVDLTVSYPETYAYSMNKYRIDGIFWVPTSSEEYIKQKITELGACDAAVYYSNGYMNTETHAYCTRDITYTNHAVVIVGWDDNYPKENFLQKCRPEKDGAWLVRNSWGEDWAYGEEGCFWLSYEDSAFCSPDNEVAFYSASPVDNEYNVYQYDGSAAQGNMQGASDMLAANVFTAADEYEALDSVAFFTKQSNLEYSIEVYTGVSEVPDDGTRALSSPKTGVLDTGGYHTVTLDEPVNLVKGEKFSIIINLRAADGQMAKYMLDCNVNTGYWKHTSFAADGQSFYYNPGQGWSNLKDCTDNGVFRIKGITVEAVHPRTIIHRDSGVELTTSGEESSVTRHTGLTVGTPELSSELIASVPALSGTYTALEIALVENGDVILPSCGAEIRIPIPEELDVERPELYFVSGNAATKCDAENQDGVFRIVDARPGIYIIADGAHARLPGDVNSDGRVSMLDSTILRRWLADWDVSISQANADVSGNGEVDMRDSVLLRRYLAGWSGIELE